MKVTQEKAFTPITVVFETEEEACAYRNFIGGSLSSARKKISGITDRQDDILHKIYVEIDDLL